MKPDVNDDGVTIYHRHHSYTHCDGDDYNNKIITAGIIIVALMLL